MSVAATIVIPTHDHGPMLRASIASVLRQTVADIEVFVIGDGVPQESREIMSDLMRSDPRVRFFDHPKGKRHGEIYRHRALCEAAGKIVCYLSDDDLYLPDHVETMLELLKSHDFAHTMAARVGAHGQITTWNIDLGIPAYRRELLEGRNRIPLSAGAHTIEAYRKLREGWSTSPTGTPTDLYMWQKFLWHPEFRYRGGSAVTVLNFPSTERTDFSQQERAAELKHWFDSTGTAEGRADLFRHLLAAKAREALDADATAVESRQAGAVLPAQALVQVFYPSPTGHNEAASIVKPIRIGSWQKLSIEVPYQDPDQPIRIDPATEPCIVEFADIAVRARDRTMLWRLANETSSSIAFRGTGYPLHCGNSIRLFSDGMDPIVVLPPLGERLSEATVLLELLMRVDVDVRRLRNCALNRAGI